tara:strand:+ start:108 stop:290 length:183 start_codon:yes stop_codon:yes gene_type:complete
MNDFDDMLSALPDEADNDDIANIFAAMLIGYDVDLIECSLIMLMTQTYLMKYYGVDKVRH